MECLNVREVCSHALQLYGIEAQLLQLQEECAELIVAVSHFRRKQNTKTSRELVEEIADVSIMVEQMRAFFTDNNIDVLVQNKLLRLNRRMNLAKVAR